MEGETPLRGKNTSLWGELHLGRGKFHLGGGEGGNPSVPPSIKHWSGLPINRELIIYTEFITYIPYFEDIIHIISTFCSRIIGQLKIPLNGDNFYTTNYPTTYNILVMMSHVVCFLRAQNTT